MKSNNSPANKKQLISALKKNEDVFKNLSCTVGREMDLGRYSGFDIIEKAQALDMKIYRAVCDITSAIGDSSKVQVELNRFKEVCEGYMESTYKVYSDDDGICANTMKGGIEELRNNADTITNAFNELKTSIAREVKAQSVENESSLEV